MFFGNGVHGAFERAVECASVADFDMINLGSRLELRNDHDSNHGVQTLLHEASKNVADAGLVNLLLEGGILDIDVEIIIDVVRWNSNFYILHFYK